MQILIGLLLTILPVSELRGGLPVIVEYAIRHGVSVWPYFLMVLVLNVLLILLIFMFFDFFHELQVFIFKLLHFQSRKTMEPHIKYFGTLYNG